MATATERLLRNALKFGQSGEVDSQEGKANVEGLELAPPDYSEVGAPQVELNGAVGEALMLHPSTHQPPTKHPFDILIDDPFFDSGSS